MRTNEKQRRNKTKGNATSWQQLTLLFGAGDGNRTNPNEPNKALPPAFQFNWSQMESDLA